MDRRDCQFRGSPVACILGLHEQVGQLPHVGCRRGLAEGLDRGQADGLLGTAGRLDQGCGGGLVGPSAESGDCDLSRPAVAVAQRIQNGRIDMLAEQPGQAARDGLGEFSFAADRGQESRHDGGITQAA